MGMKVGAFLNEGAFFVCFSAFFATFVAKYSQPMNRYCLTMGLALALVATASCGGKKEERTIVVHKTEQKKPLATKRVGDFSQERNVEWLGAVYRVVVSRAADPSLPQVADVNGNKYYDNRITVRVLRKDGSEFFRRKFSKADFERYVDRAFSKSSVLYSIVLVGAEGNNLCFAASVGSPNQMVSDEYVPFTLRLSRTGSLTISKDQKLDTSNEEDEDNDGSRDIIDDGEAED